MLHAFFTNWSLKVYCFEIIDIEQHGGDFNCTQFMNGYWKWCYWLLISSFLMPFNLWFISCMRYQSPTITRTWFKLLSLCSAKGVVLLCGTEIRAIQEHNKHTPFCLWLWVWDGKYRDLNVIILNLRHHFGSHNDEYTLCVRTSLCSTHSHSLIQFDIMLGELGGGKKSYMFSHHIHNNMCVILFLVCFSGISFFT